MKEVPRLVLLEAACRLRRQSFPEHRAELSVSRLPPRGSRDPTRDRKCPVQGRQDAARPPLVAADAGPHASGGIAKPSLWPHNPPAGNFS